MRFRSVWVMAMVAAKSAVATPMPATQAALDGAKPKRTAERATRYTPAVTIVAAWIRAETGVGPAMASGSHMYNGNWADLPVTPSSMNRVIARMTGGGTLLTAANTPSKSSVLKAQKMKKIAISMPKSPMRLT